MRCQSCNTILTDSEVVLKDENNEYFDLCEQCLEDIFPCEYLDMEFENENS